ncbi:methyltransferase [Actinoplanes sp. N902-109]|uniref:methyltransferase n=1 Tax=Actinoplanes sp. (strain N902-109) TaxID=649831 RepID=UPI0012F83E03|nr:methyltransferase [Actinoplanes sp. N902-109]
MELSFGGWISASIGVAARLGVADVLAEEPKSADELAKSLDVLPDTLTPVLNALTMAGIFAYDEQGRLTNNETSEPLRTNHPQSMRNLAILLNVLYFQSLGSLVDAVKTGQPALNLRFGMGLYEVMEQDPEMARILDLAMQEWTRPVGATILEHFPFDNVTSIVDVGGGNGELLKTLLGAHPHLRGTVVDRADTCRRAAAALQATGNEDLVERLTFQPGDMFTEIPSGADLYVIKNVLHDWNSESAVTILSNISAAMRDRPADAPEPMLVIMDPVREYDSGSVLRPLIKLVIGEQGTGERTEADIRRETTAAGLQVLSISPLPMDLAAIACKLAPAVA